MSAKKVPLALLSTLYERTCIVITTKQSFSE